MNFTLNETTELLDMIEVNMASCKTVSSKVREKIAVIDQKIRTLQEVRGLMLRLSDGEDPCCTPEVTNDNCRAIVTGILRPHHDLP